MSRKYRILVLLITMYGCNLWAIDEVYVCPMHPEEISHETVSCSKCGMLLVKQTLPSISQKSLTNLGTNSNNKPILKGFDFVFPNMKLVDHRNQSIELARLFNSDKNVVFAFFFTHCVTVCTTITLSLKSIQGNLPSNTNIIMISIDPDTDSPSALKKYAFDHNIIEPNWYLLTGKKHQIINLQKSFESYRGNKMNHTTSLFVKKAYSKLIYEVKDRFSSIPQLLNPELSTSGTEPSL